MFWEFLNADGTDMKFQVTTAMWQWADPYISDKGSCCGNRNFEEYLDNI